MSDEDIEIAIMFTVHNGTTLKQQQKGGEHTQPVSDAACVRMAHPIDGSPGSYALATEGVIGDYEAGPNTPKAYACAEWPAESFESLYNAFVSFKGKLPSRASKQGGPAVGSKGGLGAVSSCIKVPAKGSAKLCFSLAWDFPVANFGSSNRKYHLKYTQWYGRDGKASLALAILALREHNNWREKIEAWQRPILSNKALPQWYKTVLFNETYFLTAGGSLWTVDGGLHPSKDTSEVGHWLYLEGMEYRMHNTYDVHFYASFALTMLFPLLEKSVTIDVADCIVLEWLDTRTFLHSGTGGVRKMLDCVPHDLGGPTEDPWGKPNIYCIHDTSKWKDLPLKFVLMVYRDYVALGNDIEFLTSMWEPIKRVLSVCCRCFDTDGSGMIQNEPWPDQTYDAWKAKGVTAYCGGLWLAALRVAERVAELLGKKDEHEHFKKCLVRAQAAYSVLWNSKGYYNYDSSKSSHSDSIMADQCCGEWYIRSCGLPSVLPDGNAKAALRTVYSYNVKKFGHKAHQGDKGPVLRGAVNGMRPDGCLDTSSMQSMECWTGTTFAVAAHMLMEGLTQEGFDTAKGVYEGSFKEFGFWFSTPEAWLGDGSFRSLGYMRPLSVWGMQWGLEQNGLLGTNTKDHLQ
eukprot:TRINITY_DN9021_c0_g1_i1.p1 TRINITY_DN9021_c0_g1~~TRINITY_DN9021_c0_g1_i1.p1  ORF type:complete len:628 (+),score=111.43 TRINITY_DN9021_c0_g1_i1:390-2273(+)